MKNNVKKKLSKKLKFAALIFCVVMLVCCVSFLGYIDFLQRSDDYVRFDKSRLSTVCSGLKILDANGDEIREALSFDGHRRIPLSALHDYTYRAFVAVEDKRFFEHDGLDKKRILGAVFHNLKSGTYKEGASTISQQLIKNTHLDSNKNLKRKVNEMLLALELEKNYTKEEILEMYLNTIYFGRNAYGLESAANVYFDKSASELTVSESAILAGMIKAPNTYAPDKNPQKCKKRRDFVLKLMLEQNVISDEVYLQALNSEIVYKPFCAALQKGYVSCVLDEACKLLNMSSAQLYKSDFIIETYYDDSVQQALLASASADATANKDGSPADVSCVVTNNDGGIAACYFRGTLCFVRKQVGSTAKPFAVYTPALCEKLITQASPVLDEPTNFDGYKPSNAGGYNGWTTIKYAVAKSLNIPAVKTLNTLGLAKAQQYLSKLGIEGNQNLSLALGNFDNGLTIFELANSYVTLANGGTNNGVGFIRAIYNSDGEIFRRNVGTAKVFDEQSAYLMTDMLKNAVAQGTAKFLKNCTAEVAAKTGTVGNEHGNTEAILCGYTTSHTFVFWYSGDFDNSVSGGTAPCKLAASVLNEIYQDNSPRPFIPPSGIEQLAIDDNELKQNRQVKLSLDGSGEKFLFESGNKPKFVSATVPRQQISALLSTKNQNGKILFDLPAVDGAEWKIFRKDSDGETEIKGNEASTGLFFARLFEGNIAVYTTPAIYVRLPEKLN